MNMTTNLEGFLILYYSGFFSYMGFILAPIASSRKLNHAQ